VLLLEVCLEKVSRLVCSHRQVLLLLGYHCRVNMPDEGYSILVDRYSPWAGNKHVLRLQIGVNDTANSVQVVKTNQCVCGNLTHNLERNSFEVESLDER